MTTTETKSQPAPVESLTRLAAMISRNSEMLKARVQPGHADYISKNGAGHNLDYIQEQIEAWAKVKAEILAALESVVSDLGDAEWGSDEDGAYLFQETIDKHYHKIKAVIAKAKGERP